MITAEQRQLRHGLIGASDAPAIVGVDPYKSAADVWAVARGLVTIEENEHMRRGTFLEPALLNFAEADIGSPIARDVMLIHSDGLRCANLDGISELTKEFQEVKTSKVRKGWGEPGSDEVPDRVKIQIAQGFDCADDAGIKLNVCRVVALLEMDIVTYFVPRDDELIQAVRDRVRSFHRNELQSPEPPSGSTIDIDLLKRINRIPEKVVNIDPKVVAEWQEAKAKREEWEAIEQAKKEKMIAQLDDAEAGQFPDGLVTYFSANRFSIDTKRLKAEHPEIAAKYATTTTYRTLRLKKSERN